MAGGPGFPELLAEAAFGLASGDMDARTGKRADDHLGVITRRDDRAARPQDCMSRRRSATEHA